MTAVEARDRARLLKGAGINLVGAIGKFLTPAYLILANQIFGPAAFGLYSLTLAPLEMLNNFVVTGFKDAVERFAARDPDATEAGDEIYSILWRCLLWVLAMAAIGVGVLVVVGKPLVVYAWSRPELYRVLLLFACNVPLVGVMIILLSATRALMIMHPDVIVTSFAVPAVMIACAFLLHPSMPSVYGLVLSYTIANGVGMLLAMVYFARYYSLRRLWAARKVPTREKLARFAVPQSVNMMLTLATWNLDVMMLGSFVGDAQIGFYRTAAEIARSMTQLRFVFSGVYSPLVARYAREKNVPAMQESFDLISRWVLAVAAPLTVLVFLYRAEILWVFNPAYNQSATFMALLLVGPLFNAATGLTGNILVMAGFPFYNLLNGVLLTIVNGCLNYFLIPVWNLAGAAFATMVAQLGVGILQIVEVRRLVGVRVRWTTLLRPSFAAVASLAAAWGVASLAAPWPIAAIVVQGLVAVVVYVGLMFAPIGRRFSFARPTIAPPAPPAQGGGST
jgi:O-antigen/teichoic acid export membrane protein